MIAATGGFNIAGLDLQELFAAHTSQDGYLTRMCSHSYCDFLSVAELLKAPDNTVKTFGHVHDAYEFLVPLEPTPMIMQQDAVYFGEVGYVYPIMGGRPHGVQVEYSDISNYNIVVAKAFIEQRLAEKGLAGGAFNSRFEASPELNSLLRLFAWEFEKGAASDRIDMNLLGALIVSVLIETGCRPMVDRRKPQQQYQRGMKSVVTYINRHFTENLSIDFLADMSGFTKNYFISTFRKMMGEAPYTHIKKLRISKAKVLLENTDLSVNDIAVECGFEKASSFTSLFKSETGTAPTGYRRKFRDKRDTLE